MFRKASVMLVTVSEKVRLGRTEGKVSSAELNACDETRWLLWANCGSQRRGRLSGGGDGQKKHFTHSKPIACTSTSFAPRLVRHHLAGS